MKREERRKRFPETVADEAFCDTNSPLIRIRHLARGRKQCARQLGLLRVSLHRGGSAVRPCIERSTTGRSL
jgi:hypothetical protein